MPVRSFIAASLAFGAVLCAVVLPRAAAIDTQPNSSIGYACRQGCNNLNGCSLGKFTVWNPHVECRMTYGMVTCRDSQTTVLCYSQWTYQNYDCTGQQIGDRYDHYTPDCVPL